LVNMVELTPDSRSKEIEPAAFISVMLISMAFANFS
jgi:hypothetical protein